MSLTLDGSIVSPVGLPPPPLIVQLPSSDPPTVYLKTLSLLDVLLSTQMLAPSVTRSVASLLLLLRLKLLAAFWLPLVRVAAPL